MDLSGTWRAALADDDLRRSGIGLDTDDSTWAEITVPGHWRAHPDFAASDGPLLYRTRFDLEPPDEATRHFVVFDGIFYQADVWLDGAYLGDPEGYFFPHAYDISDLARLQREHVLAVELACTPPGDRSAKRAITGVFQDWDCLDPSWNPGGIWRPVRIETTGPVRIETLRVLCRDADIDRAVVDVVAVLDSDAGRTVKVRTEVGGQPERELEYGVAKGANTVEWSFGIDGPELWWPWALGGQPLTDVAVTVECEGEVSHSRTVRTGLRQIGLHDWRLSVNGERLFVKGANLGPTRMALAEATPEELRRDVMLAKEAGLDLLRIHGHITRPELYDAADELGMLVWQDFPLQLGYHRSVRRQAVRQAAEAVNVLGHHPSIAVWCGHNEPVGSSNGHDRSVSYLLRQETPFTWNRTVLDRSVKRAFEKNDQSRPVIAHSGVAPHPPQLDGTDSHLYFGWYHGHERDLPGFAATVPRMVRFVSEFGAQAVPNDAAFMRPELWPDLEWDQLAEHHSLQKAIFDRRVPPAEYMTFASWRNATQMYQATLVKHHVEHLRRLKYRPTGGFCVFSLADSHPAVTWSVLGHDRSAKHGYYALVEACRPVIVVADRLPATLKPGQAIGLDIHVVSDLRQSLEGAEVTARLTWADGGEHIWRWHGDVPADACERVGIVRFVAPASAGPIILDLDLTCGDVVASNRTTSVIV
jgi:beta-mannosidase